MHRISKLDLICGLLILLFTYTAISKWMDFSHFQHTLGQSPLIKSFDRPISWIVPTLEIFISMCLAIPSLRKTGLMWSLIILTIFTIYIGYMLLFTPHLPCSCGGVVKQLSWRQHLLFNLFFIMLSILGLFQLKKHRRNWSPLIPFPTKEDIL